MKQDKGYELIQSVNELLDTRVEHQRIKEFGSHSKIRTIIRKEALKLGQFLREEKSYFNLFQRLLRGISY